MKRTIIEIDEEKCTGCELCVDACHEGAIHMVNGKAKLLRDDYCDGLGDCLPACPADAISFVERDTKPYDEEAVRKNKERKAVVDAPADTSADISTNVPADAPVDTSADVPTSDAYIPSRLGQWPIQVKIMPIQAPYYQGADLLIASDCTAFAFAAFHSRYMADKVTIIGCPKLDAVDYSEKLFDIISENDIRSITVVRMEVPCCKGLEQAARLALERSGKDLPFDVHIITIDGKIQD